MSARCDQCGKKLDNSGNCAACLFQLGITGAAQIPVTQSPAGQGLNLPSVEELNVQFSQLEINRLIGRGGMGAIYQAQQTALDRTVAIKLIAREVAGDTAFIERFEREAKTLAKLSHPNIVTVYDFGRTADGQAYLIMEYVDGINLREAILSGSVGPNDALEIIQSICSALEYAHGKGVVHRDIKPENILLGEDGTVKVADFGIAKIIDDAARSPTLTATRQVLGSLNYLAPEHLEAPNEVDHRVDLYALGVVFYELLTGQLPLGRYEAPSAIQRGVDARLDAVALKMLHRKPSQRYQSAGEVTDELERISKEHRRDEIPVLEPVQFHPSASVPFTCDTWGGLAEEIGMLHSDGSSLTAEYRTRDTVFGNLKSKEQVVKIPKDQILSIQLHSGIFGSKIVARGKSISTLGNLPNSETGQVVFKIKHRDQDLAVQMLDVLNFTNSSASSGNSGAYAFESDVVGSRWNLFAILTIFCGILNAGFLAVMQVSLASTHGFEQIAGGVTVAVVFGPIAFLQVAVGVLSLFARPRSLARTTAVVSMLPITPAMFISFPVGLWAYLWLSPSTTQPIALPKPTKGWGATTLMFIRESRWSKLIAGANIAALILSLLGIGIYSYGYFPVQSDYRIIDPAVDVETLRVAVQARVGDLATIHFPRSDRLMFSQWKKDKDRVHQLLAIEGQIQLVWLAATVEPEAAKPDAADLLASHESWVASSQGIEMRADLMVQDTVLGRSIATLGKEMQVSPTFASKITTTADSRRQLVLELTAAGRELLAQPELPHEQVAGLGLLVEGVLEGFASRDEVSGSQITIELAGSSRFTTAAVAAAIRGPSIPSDLEILE